MSGSVQIDRAVNEKSRLSKTKSNGIYVISNFPENIVSRILSLLPTKDAVRTCVLSKDWEYKWTNIETIDIDDSVLFSQPSIINESFVKFVDRILLLCHVKEFRLKCSENYGKGPLVTWISSLLRRDVPNIDITYRHGDIVMPRCLFNSCSLTKLKLHLPCTLIVPARNWFSRLKNLDLGQVVIVNEVFPHTGQLILTFPVLESLELQYCKWLNAELVEINAPVLKRFKSCSAFFEAACSYQIKIFGSALETFETSDEIHNGLQARTLLKGFVGLKHLKLLAAKFSGLSRTKLEIPLPRFDGLKQLEICIFGKNGAFLELLDAAPFLETLIITTERWSNSIDYEFESVPPCVVSHLKEVRFHGFWGFDEHIQLAEYFLNNAVKLEKMLGLSRKKCIKNRVVRNFWVKIKRILEKGDLELGDKIKEYI